MYGLMNANLVIHPTKTLLKKQNPPDNIILTLFSSMKTKMVNEKFGDILSKKEISFVSRFLLIAAYYILS